MGTDLFTYGSLIFPAMMNAVTGRVLRSEPARLADFQRFALVDRSYPGIVPSRGDVTLGRIYFDVTEEGLERLDSFEGDEYRRESVRIALAGDVSARAQAYVLLPGHRSLITGQAWDEQRFMDSELAESVLETKYWMDHDEDGGR